MKKEFMRQAIELAKTGTANHQGGPFGAVVVKDNQVIGSGFNQVTHHNDPTAHAEMNAIRAAAKFINNFKLDGCEIYTSCEPCPMCLCAIYWARIDIIYVGANRSDAKKIGFDDQYFYEQIAKSIDHRDIPVVEVLRNEAVAVFEQWHADTNKIMY